MKNEQTKSLVVNILTGVVILGLIYAGYSVFKGKSGTSTTGTASVVERASETAQIGKEIEVTVRDLSDLSRAVASSTAIFQTTGFQNLVNFSSPISNEGVGRANPFTLTDWKLKLNALQSAKAGS